VNTTDKTNEINYPYIINILKKMYGYDVSMDDLKTFENTSRYKRTDNSNDYIEQYNDYIDEMKGVKHYFNKLKLKEETGTSSTGSYETPGFLAKNIPNMRQGAKTTYGGKGGKFVKIKSKCRKFPYCSQGAVDSPLELSDKYKGESSLSGEMELTPTYPKGYKGNVHLPKTKWVNEGLEYSGKDVTELPIIGRVITYPIGPYGEGEENVVEIIKGNNNEDIYVTDKWYKEYKRIPLIIHSKLVKEYIPNNINEEVIPGGKSSGMTIIEIAKKHKILPQIVMKEWLKGIKVEMEHTNNKRIAREIAKDHLYEDIYYYKKLSKIEK
jgi:hypothetical protein